MNSSTVILIAFFTSVITSLGTVYMAHRSGVLTEATPVVVVPDVKGLTEADARVNLEAAGLVPMMGAREASAEAKAGTVVRQSIPPAQRVDKGRVVTVVLADELPTAPRVEGLSLAEATVLLEGKGYKLQVLETVADEKVPTGKIISQVPAPDQALEKGRAVAVKVSSGAGTVEVPKLVGVAMRPAQAQLEKLGLKPAMRWISQAETVSYVVLQQKPAPGEKVAAGGEVELIVNR